MWLSQVEEREKFGDEERAEEKEKREGDEEHKDLEKGGEVGVEEQVERDTPGAQRDFHVSMLQRLNPSNPLRVAIPGMNRAATPSPAQPRSTPTPQVKTRGKISKFLSL